MLNPITGNKKPHRANDGVSTCLTAVTDQHKAHKTHKDYAMNQDQKATQQQLCINHCSQARNNESCSTCLLSTAVQRDAATQAVLDSIDESSAKTDELTDSMIDQSASRADWAVFCGLALFIAISVMWFFSQSKPVVSIASMCGGAL